jgi:citrate synthase
MPFLIFTGRRPSDGEGRVLEALMVSVMEYGISPSSMVSRLMASYGVPIQVGIASGALTMGDFHGGSGEAAAQANDEAMRAFSARDIDTADLEACAEHFVAAHRDAGRPVYGFGHPRYDSESRSRSPGLWSPHTGQFRRGVGCASS